jgi:hypothetical protein
MNVIGAAGLFKCWKEERDERDGDRLSVSFGVVLWRLYKENAQLIRVESHTRHVIFLVLFTSQ